MVFIEKTKNKALKDLLSYFTQLYIRLKSNILNKKGVS